MRTLVVEDDPTTAQSLVTILTQEGYICDSTDLGEEALEFSRLYDYDILILDLMLPDIDGYEILRRLRAAKSRVPVLVLSGLSTLDDRLKGLGVGADDYLTKPFDRRELVARIQAIVRRSRGHAHSLIVAGELMVDLDAHQAKIAGEPVHLTAKEYGILSLLALRKGATVSKEMILDHLYGGLDEPEMKIIDVFVCKLRRKLVHASGGEPFIETIWGRGYMLREPNDAAREAVSTPDSEKAPAGERIPDRLPEFEKD